jgi:hypothetical protein
MSAFSTVAGAWSARQSSDAGGGRDLPVFHGSSHHFEWPPRTVAAAPGQEHAPAVARAGDRFQHSTGMDAWLRFGDLPVRGPRGLSVAVGQGEQPRGRPAIAWLRLSDCGSLRHVARVEIEDRFSERAALSGLPNRMAASERGRSSRPSAATPRSTITRNPQARSWEFPTWR